MQDMDFVQRDECALTGERDLEFILKIENFPVSMYTVDKTESEDLDLKADMQWWISTGTGSIQLAPLIPLDILYKKGHGSGAIGSTWEHHHAEFSDFISGFGVKRVLEIGAGHGFLAQHFVKQNPDALYYIVEPNLPSWSHDRVRFYCSMFDASFTIDHDIDAVVHSHTFEHIYEPRKFLGHVAELIQEGQWHIFSLPRLEVMLARGYSNALNFEHTLYLTEANVDYLMMSSGLEVVCKKYFRADHSVFYATRKRPSVVTGAVVPRDYDRNRTTFLRWVEETKQFVISINEKIAGHKNGKIYVFGGHIFTQFLIGFGLNVTAVSGILDNDPAKAGRRLYGTNLLVSPPNQELKGNREAVVILRAGAYNEEIKKGIVGNINPEVIFWE